MSWCPRCRTEYREGFTQCIDCHIALVQDAPEGEPPETESIQLMDPISVYETDAQQADLICHMLRNADIAAIPRDSSFGGIAKVYTGSSLYNTKVMVDRAQEQQALDFLHIWATQDDNAPVSAEDLAREATAGLTDDELAEQALAAEPAAEQPFFTLWRVPAFIVAAIIVLALVLAALTSAL